MNNSYKNKEISCSNEYKDEVINELLRYTPNELDNSCQNYNCTTCYGDFLEALKTHRTRKTESKHKYQPKVEDITPPLSIDNILMHDKSCQTKKVLILTRKEVRKIHKLINQIKKLTKRR